VGDPGQDAAGGPGKISGKEMVKESMQWRETAKSQPEPGICLELKTKTNLTCYVNLLTWARVAKPDNTSTLPSLPIAGGQQTFSQGKSVFSVCLHPSVLEKPYNSQVEEDQVDNIALLVIKFLHQVHPGLDLQHDYRLLKDILITGDLCHIRLELEGMRGSTGQLLTASPSSLISQLSDVCKQEGGGEEQICLPTCRQTENKGRKVLIEDISIDKKKPRNKIDDCFGKNLQRAFNDKNHKKGSKNNDENENIKIRQEETFLKEVKTKRINEICKS